MNWKGRKGRGNDLKVNDTDEKKGSEGKGRGVGCQSGASMPLLMRFFVCLFVLICCGGGNSRPFSFLRSATFSFNSEII